MCIEFENKNDPDHLGVKRLLLVLILDLLSGLIVSSAAQLIELGSELVLVETGVLQRQLHLVQLLGGVLGFHLEPLLSAGHVSHAPVEVSDLDVVLVDGDLKLFNNLHK